MRAILLGKEMNVDLAMRRSSRSPPFAHWVIVVKPQDVANMALFLASERSC